MVSFNPNFCAMANIKNRVKMALPTLSEFKAEQSTYSYFYAAFAAVAKQNTPFNVDSDGVLVGDPPIT